MYKGGRRSKICLVDMLMASEKPQLRRRRALVARHCLQRCAASRHARGDTRAPSRPSNHADLRCAASRARCLSGSANSKRRASARRCPPKWPTLQPSAVRQRHVRSCKPIRPRAWTVCAPAAAARERRRQEAERQRTRSAAGAHAGPPATPWHATRFPPQARRLAEREQTSAPRSGTRPGLGYNVSGENATCARPRRGRQAGRAQG